MNARQLIILIIKIKFAYNVLNIVIFANHKWIVFSGLLLLLLINLVFQTITFTMTIAYKNVLNLLVILFIKFYLVGNN